MSVAPATITPTTLEEFLALPETKPAQEFIFGAISQKPMPKLPHSTLQVQIASLINRMAQPQKLAYAFPELRCSFAGMSIVPDIVILRWQKIPFQPDGSVADEFNAVPDWLIEIVSPGQSPLAVMNKLGIAITNGVELGWLIIPHRRSILVYTGDDIPEMKQGGDTLPVLAVIPEWRITVEEIFQLLSIG
jgi:Uma2 family endonuclease